MADDIDRITNGHRRTCSKCPGVLYEDLNVEVVIALLNNHNARWHKPKES